ncbi:hypothetical protein [Nocardioides plantarum]|uniref:Uncharacterized protein n=1 Tax=Nocardioides plantarum TaxID=29299 RepID=A0ABV5KCW6_9ACTN|nr:hypothetical protein [Nocardioides plantarum]
MKKTLALTAAGTLLATPLAVLVAAPAAHADVDRKGACGTGRYELSVDREGSRHEVSVDLDRVPARSSWIVQITQDGKKIAHVTRTAARDGELDVERVVADTAGKDTFRFTAKRVGARTSCGASVVVS